MGALQWRNSRVGRDEVFDDGGVEVVEGFRRPAQHAQRFCCVYVCKVFVNLCVSGEREEFLGGGEGDDGISEGEGNESEVRECCLTHVIVHFQVNHCNPISRGIR